MTSIFNGGKKTANRIILLLFHLRPPFLFEIYFCVTYLYRFFHVEHTLYITVVVVVTRDHGGGVGRTVWRWGRCDPYARTDDAASCYASGTVLARTVDCVQVCA